MFFAFIFLPIFALFYYLWSGNHMQKKVKTDKKLLRTKKKPYLCGCISVLFRVE